MWVWSPMMMAFVSLPCGQSLKLLIGKATDLWPYFCRSSNRSTNTSTSSCFTFPDPVFHLGTTTLAAFLSSFSTYKNLLCPKIERKEHLLAVNNWMSKHYFEMFCSIKGTFFSFKFSLFNPSWSSKIITFCVAYVQIKQIKIVLREKSIEKVSY